MESGWQAWYSLIPAYISTNLNVEADCLAQGRLVLEWHLLPHIAQAVFKLGVIQRWICWHPHKPINFDIIHMMENLLPLGALVKCFQGSLDISGELCVSSPCIHSPSSVQVSGKTWHRSFHISDPYCTLLDGRSLAYNNSQHVRRFSSFVSYCERSHYECFGRLGVKGLPLLNLTLLLLRDAFCVLFLSLSGSSRGNLNTYNKGFVSIVGKIGKVAVHERVYQTMPFLTPY